MILLGILVFVLFLILLIVSRINPSGELVLWGSKTKVPTTINTVPASDRGFEKITVGGLLDTASKGSQDSKVVVRVYLKDSETAETEGIAVYLSDQLNIDIDGADITEHIISEYKTTELREKFKAFVKKYMQVQRTDATKIYYESERTSKSADGKSLDQVVSDFFDFLESDNNGDISS